MYINFVSEYRNTPMYQQVAKPRMVGLFVQQLGISTTIDQIPCIFCSIICVFFKIND